MVIGTASSLITDYLVFVIFIFLSTLYPIWHDRHTKNEASTVQNYVFAKGRVSMFAVMLSIARGMCGIAGFIGYPSELFYRGIGMWETIYGLLTSYIIVCFLFVPIYCSLDVTSIYQYLEMRFNSRLVRCLAAGTFLFRQVFTLGITIYIPCIVIQTIFGLQLLTLTIGMTILIIIFILLAGLKAAITADVIQGLLLIVVSLGIIIHGTYYAGGIEQVYRINNNNDRLNFFTFSGDITTRVDTLSAWIGQTVMSVSVMGCHQNLAQRLLSMTSVKEVRSLLIRNMPFITVLFSLSWIVGMVIYATYYLCDPLSSGYIQKMDQILPFYVEDRLLTIPGVLGIFVATLFNGALCMAVSNINSMATVAWEDFLSQISIFRNLLDRKQLYAIKLLGIMFCIINLGIVAIVSTMSGVIECFMLISSITSGPLVGVFVLALLIPIANSKGAAIGMCSAHIISFTLVIGSQIFKLPQHDLLPTSIEKCTNDTFSPWITKREFTTSAFDTNEELINFQLEEIGREFHSKTTMDIIFNITYMYYATIGSMVTIIIGTIVSMCTKSEKDKFDHKLLHSIVLRCWKMTDNNSIQ